jgi:hypothetical protein
MQYTLQVSFYEEPANKERVPFFSSYVYKVAYSLPGIYMSAHSGCTDSCSFKTDLEDKRVFNH